MLLLLGIGGLAATAVALIVMEQELYRIGFFTNQQHPALQLPKIQPKTAPESSPSLFSPPSTIAPAPPAPPRPQAAEQPERATAPVRTAETISGEDRKQLEDITAAAHRKEEFSREDKKHLDDILRSR